MMHDDNNLHPTTAGVEEDGASADREARVLVTERCRFIVLNRHSHLMSYDPLTNLRSPGDASWHKIPLRSRLTQNIDQSN